MVEPNSSLPLDVFIHILSHLPPSPKRGCHDPIYAFVGFLEASTLLREAAKVPSLWEPHYRVRYTHCDEQAEARRLSTLNGDWRLLYVARRRLDSKALRCLDEIIRQRNGQLEHAKSIFELSFDIWDVMQTEAEQPVPEPFRRTNEYPSVDITHIAPNALTRRYWARSIMESISRSYAIDLWTRSQRGDESVSFVESFSALSCFMGKSPRQMSEIFLPLMDRCRAYLSGRGCVLDPDDGRYDLAELCISICSFMRSEGFDAVDPENFHSLLNILPHAYLTCNKKTIPISLVHIFVAISRDLGVHASPVDFPARVLVHVSTPDPLTDDFYVDVFGSSTKPILTLREDITALLIQHGIPPQSMVQYISPCTGSSMLLRTSRNILSSVHGDHRSSSGLAQTSLYIAFCIYLLMTSREQFAARVTMYVGLLDCVTVIPKTLVPLFLEKSTARETLEDKCRTTIQRHRTMTTVKLRSSPENTSVFYFVGMVFRHRARKYICCIYGWDNTCKQDENWIKEMNIDSLPRGRNQPFYMCFSQDGLERYVSEDNIEPTLTTTGMVMEIFASAQNFPVYFSDVVATSGDRVRLVPSPEVVQSYPEDEIAARHWLEERSSG
ncbi:uncharacterized protein BT62DRAFT_1071472 [Guyanagaster necrorhizus]|uniref:Hemimethylated DNA-binding domain-containing protein n=1 Tax=Guyanagaster necrorhizus TaxID=856835 RepID=A0A9P7W4B1_9AGAR|nr:uncharacterized protein BT62DRAFT_1071472 [Guyanagaster necrorhizus MCA 3950]KAG7452319.1 hypothetical protein BT62DRAFT_1071472 [Guyanagaster necrorhizus MCA 3950]